MKSICTVFTNFGFDFIHYCDESPGKEKLLKHTPKNSAKDEECLTY